MSEHSDSSSVESPQSFNNLVSDATNALWLEPEFQSQVLDALDALPKEELFGALQTLAQLNNDVEIPPDIVESLCERIFADIEDQSEREAQDDPTYINHALCGVYLIMIRTSNLRLADQVFKTLPGLAHQYPRTSHGFLEVMKQDHAVSPGAHVETLADTVSRDDEYVGRQFKREMFEFFIHRRTQSPIQYDAAFAKTLDFEDPKSFAATSYILSSYSLIHNMSSGVGFTADQNSPFYRKVAESVEQGKGSYVLHLRAKNLLEQVRSGMPVFEEDRLPILISGRRYLLIESGVPYLSNERDYDKITALITEFGQATNIENQEHVLGGISCMFTGDPIWLEVGVDTKDADAYLHPSDEQIDYMWLTSKPVRTVIEKEFYFKLSDLALEEQFYFLNFLKTKGIKDADSLKEFTGKFGTTGMRTFLSLEYGRDFGDKIVSLGERLPENTARSVFAKYAEIIDLVKRVPTEILEGTANKGDTWKHQANMKETLLRYGRKLLEGFATKAEKGLQEGDAQKLEQQLNEIRTDIVLSASLFKSLFQEGISIAEISTLNLETLQRADLDEADKAEMLRIFKENREDYPENLRERTIGDFEEILNEGDREFHIMKKGKEIIGFARFDPLSNDAVYIGSLNVQRGIQSLTVGGAFLLHLLKEKSKTHRIEAEAFSGNKMLQNYTDKYGFKIVGQIPNYHGSGQLFYKMEIPKGSLS